MEFKDIALVRRVVSIETRIKLMGYLLSSLLIGAGYSIQREGDGDFADK
jgi:hypothetical protein